MSIIELIRWIVGIVCLLLFACIAISHAVFLIQFFAGKVKHGSMILIVNGLIGVAGILLIPVESLHRWWWTPFFLDVGAGPLTILISGVHYIFKGRQGD